MEVDTSNILLQLQAAFKTMLDDESRTKDCCETMHNLINAVPIFFTEEIGCRSNLLEQIEQCAADVWNYAVAKKSLISAQLNAMLRYIACTIVYKCKSTKEDEESLKKQIMMSLKATRACLDSEKHEMAKNTLEIADECNNKLRLLYALDQSVGEKSPEFAENMLEVERNQLKVLMYKAELLFDPENGKQSLSLLEQASPLLSALPNEAVSVAVLCHKFGVSCYQKQTFEESVAWLKLSYELGKLSNAVSCKSQASTLRLLAKGYLDWDPQMHWQKAFNAVGLANAEHSHPLGLHLKLQILLINGSADNELIKQTLDEMISHPDLTLDVAIGTLHMICNYDKNEAAIEALNKLTERFQAQSELCRVRVAQMEIYLKSQSIISDASLHQLIQTIVQDQKDGIIHEEIIRKIQLLLWNQAAAAYESKKYSEALTWYDLCSRFFPTHSSGDGNLAKLYRNKASCCIYLDQLDRAQEELSMAAPCEPNSAYLYFLQYKLNLLKGQDKAAIDDVKRLIDSGQSSDAVELICLAANLAYKESRPSITIEALEGLATCSMDDRQVLTALRFLTRMKVTAIGSSSTLSESEATIEPGVGDQKQRQTIKDVEELRCIIGYIQKALEKLNQICGPNPVEDINREDEASWFMKIAWNVALMCDSDEEMCQLFILCHKLADLCPKNLTNVTRQKRCTLMAAALCLQLSKSTKDEAVKNKYLQDTLLYARESQSLCSYAEDLALHSFNGGNAHSKDTTSLVLLLLYEFEARVKLNDEEAEKLLERAIFLPYMEAKSFELMAAIAKQSRRHLSLSVNALKVAIKKYRAAEKIDYEKCSGAIRSLIELALQTDSLTDASNKKDAWSYFVDTMEFIDNTAKTNYPELEIVWLMTKAWNCGIHLYSGGHSQDALHWCELSMSFIKRLTVFRSSYENQMMTAYGDILAKIDAQKSSPTKSGVSNFAL